MWSHCYCERSYLLLLPCFLAQPLPDQNHSSRSISSSLPFIHSRFPLNLIPKAPIPSIKMMHPYIAILTATRIPSPQRIHSNRVERPKMALHSPDLVFEDFVVEPRFEFPLARRRGGDVHGCLTAAEDDEGFLRRQRGGVQGRVRGVGLEELEIPG